MTHNRIAEQPTTTQLSVALVVHSAVYDEPLVLSRDTFTSEKQSQLGVNQRSYPESESLASAIGDLVTISKRFSRGSDEYETR